MLKYFTWYSGEKLGTYSDLKSAQEVIYKHPAYKKSKFNKKGRATARNENQSEYFMITDNEGFGWNIK